MHLAELPVAVRRARTQRGFQGRQRSATDWTRIVQAEYATVPAATKSLLFTIVLSNSGISETVRRTRGMFSITSDQTAATETLNGALGMMVVNNIAAAAGAASIPGPSTNASDDGWFLWEGFYHQAFAAGSGVRTGSVEFDFDSKGMRKVDEGFSVAIMVENENATDGLKFGISFSMLLSRQ